MIPLWTSAQVEHVTQGRSSGECDKEKVNGQWHFKNTDMMEADRMTNEEMKRVLVR